LTAEGIISEIFMPKDKVGEMIIKYQAKFDAYEDTLEVLKKDET